MLNKFCYREFFHVAQKTTEGARVEQADKAKTHKRTPWVFTQVPDRVKQLIAQKRKRKKKEKGNVG